jgi:pimeloyl-ACP methyl ester carboxylesterase
MRKGILLAAAALAGLVVSVPTAHASTMEECNDVPVIYFVHGIEEGPNVAHPQLSQSPTLETFADDLRGSTGISYRTVADVYPAASVFNIPGTWDTYMNDGERNLQSDITYWNDHTCSGERQIALVGYSMGAWVIDKWLKDNPAEWYEVSSVVLFGDPCWVRGYNEGLTRLFLFDYGCGPTQDYPYPAARVPFPIYSFSLNKDPVSGQGFSGGLTVLNADRQLASAVACISPVTCPHLDYQAGWAGAEAVEDGASFVASRLGS